MASLPCISDAMLANYVDQHNIRRWLFGSDSSITAAEASVVNANGAGRLAELLVALSRQRLAAYVGLDYHGCNAILTMIVVVFSLP